MFVSCNQRLSPAEGLASLVVGLLLIFFPQQVTQAQFTETDLLRASNLENSSFGFSVSIDGDYLVAGAPYEDGGGAAYLFERKANGKWEEIQALRPFGIDADDEFGAAVAIEGDALIIGARDKEGPNGQENQVGAAYVFELKSDGGWDKTATLRASDFANQDIESDWFGASVDIWDDHLVVGAQFQTGPSDSTPNAGAAYIFKEDGTWQPDEILHASNFEDNDQFGGRVAIDQDLILVGAHREDGPSNSTDKAGAAYLFKQQSDGTWQEVKLLRASNFGGNDQFGYSVALDSGQLIVGARREDGPSNNADDTGALYVFEKQSDNSWQESQILRTSDLASRELGFSVSIEGGFLLSGAQNDEAYVFEKQPDDTWKEVDLLTPENQGENFGNDIDVNNGRLVVGAPLKDSESYENAGAAYTFVPSSTIPVELSSFDVRRDGEAVDVTWHTGSETNNAGFEVQRRVSSKWESISFIEGAGTTSKPQTYRFQDSNLPFEAESVTYRLKQVDTDGTILFSDTRTLKIGAPNQLSLHAPFPNPAQGQVTLRYALPRKADVSIRVYDVMGREVTMFRRGPEDAGRKEIQVPTSGLSSGVYFVRLQANETVKTERLTVVK